MRRELQFGRCHSKACRMLPFYHGLRLQHKIQYGYQRAGSLHVVATPQLEKDGSSFGDEIQASSVGSHTEKVSEVTNIT